MLPKEDTWILGSEPVVHAHLEEMALGIFPALYCPMLTNEKKNVHNQNLKFWKTKSLSRNMVDKCLSKKFGINST